MPCRRQSGLLLSRPGRGPEHWHKWAGQMGGQASGQWAAGARLKEVVFDWDSAQILIDT